MDTTKSTHDEGQSPATEGRLSRREAMLTTAVGAALAVSSAPVWAEASPGPSYGAPVVELCVPAGQLLPTEKADLIKRVTDVALDVLKLPPDPDRRMFVEIFETANNGFGVNGQVYTPAAR